MTMAVAAIDVAEFVCLEPQKAKFSVTRAIRKPVWTT